jgi:hypothetical protein
VKRDSLGICVCTAAVAIALSGCGDSTAEIERTVTARGVLTHRGQPLPYYQLMFHPGEGHRPAAGISDEKGKFVLGTNGEGDGAAAGKHRVSVVYVGPPSANPEAGMNDFSPPPPPKVKLAAKYSQPETSGITLEIPASGSSDLKVEVP